MLIRTSANKVARGCTREAVKHSLAVLTRGGVKYVALAGEGADWEATQVGRVKASWTYLLWSVSNRPGGRLAVFRQATSSGWVEKVEEEKWLRESRWESL